MIVDLAELPARLAPGDRVMGLDVGRKTIGLALSDTTLTVASALETIRRSRFREDAARLQELIAEHRVGGLVVGLPVGMDGREGPSAQSVRQFAANLLHVLDMPVAFWDERLSTAAIERLLVREADMSRRRRGQVVDKMAAAYILQGALDSLKPRPGRGPRP